jgi:GTPase SAR1 family protein
MAPLYYRDALGAILVYDISYKESFIKVLFLWVVITIIIIIIIIIILIIIIIIIITNK